MDVKSIKLSARTIVGKKVALLRRKGIVPVHVYGTQAESISAQIEAEVTLEIDVDGTGLWVPYKTFSIRADEPTEHEFPEGFSAYWVRAVSSADTTATVTFRYE